MIIIYLFIYCKKINRSNLFCKYARELNTGIYYFTKPTKSYRKLEHRGMFLFQTNESITATVSSDQYNAVLFTNHWIIHVTVGL